MRLVAAADLVTAINSTGKDGVARLYPWDTAFGGRVCSAFLLFDSHEFGRGEQAGKSGNYRQKNENEKGCRKQYRPSRQRNTCFVFSTISVLEPVEPIFISVVAYQMSSAPALSAQLPLHTSVARAGFECLQQLLRTKTASPRAEKIAATCHNFAEDRNVTEDHRLTEAGPFDDGQAETFDEGRHEHGRASVVEAPQFVVTYDGKPPQAAAKLRMIRQVFEDILVARAIATCDNEGLIELTRSPAAGKGVDDKAVIFPGFNGSDHQRIRLVRCVPRPHHPPRVFCFRAQLPPTDSRKPPREVRMMNDIFRNLAAVVWEIQTTESESSMIESSQVRKVAPNPGGNHSGKSIGMRS